MTKYYSNESDFGGSSNGRTSSTSTQTSIGSYNPSSYSYQMNTGDAVRTQQNSESYASANIKTLLEAIDTLGDKVKSESLEDYYEAVGEATLGTSKEYEPFSKSFSRITTIFDKAKRIHKEIMERVDSKFTNGMDQAAASLNQVNGKDNRYQTSHLSYETKRTVRNGSSEQTVTDRHYYSISDLLDEEKAPKAIVESTKAFYQKRLPLAEEILKHKDEWTEEQKKQFEGKSKAEIVKMLYPTDLDDYDRLRVSRYQEEHKEELENIERGIGYGIALIGAAILICATAGVATPAVLTGLGAAATAYGVGSTAYSAATGKTLITGRRLSSSEQGWAIAETIGMALTFGASKSLTWVTKLGKGTTSLKAALTGAKYSSDIVGAAHLVDRASRGEDIRLDAALQLWGTGVGIRDHFSVQKSNISQTEEFNVEKFSEVNKDSQEVQHTSTITTKIINGEEYVTYRRVQGGGPDGKGSRQRIEVLEDGRVSIERPDKALSISADNGEHADYYLTRERAEGADVVEFDVPKWFHDMANEYSIPQANAKSNPNYQDGMAPRVTDPTKPGYKLEMPSPWVGWIEEYAINAKQIDGEDWMQSR